VYCSVYTRLSPASHCSDAVRPRGVVGKTEPARPRPARAANEQSEVSRSSMGSGQYRAPWGQINGQATWSCQKRDLTPYLLGNAKARRRLRAEAGLFKGGVLLKSLRQPLEHECAEVLSSLFTLSSNGR
jgi:hypothetical protein